MTQNIEQMVFEVLRSLVGQKVTISRSSRLIVDLELLSDDATAMAISLEKKLNLKVPRQEWGQVETVEDVISLLTRHTKER